MKKYMIIAAAALLFAGVTQAQVAKQPTKATTGKEVSAIKKPAAQHKAAAATTSVSPQAPAAKKSATTATTIKRKHHKKTKAVKKAESK